MLDSLSGVRCSHATHGKIDLNSEISDLNLIRVTPLVPIR